MKIQILVDTKEIWYNSYAPSLNKSLNNLGYSSELISNHRDIKKGEILFLLSCTKILPKSFLELNKKNIGVHASDLPKGRGSSPLTWQILDGNNNIPICLFDIVEGIDEGPIYLRDELILDGTELIGRIRKKLATKIKLMIHNFLENYHSIESKDQVGAPSYYKRRTPVDSELNFDASLSEQFNLLRVVDNELYPAHFISKGKKYYLRIEEGNDDTAH